MSNCKSLKSCKIKCVAFPVSLIGNSSCVNFQRCQILFGSMWQKLTFTGAGLMAKKNVLRGCGSVGRVVASDNIDPRFESSHWQILFTINCIINCVENTKLEKKKPGMAHLKRLFYSIEPGRMLSEIFSSSSVSLFTFSPKI